MGGVSFKVHETKIAAAVAAERERCAAIADRFKTETETPFARGQHSAAFNIALAIRVPEQSRWAAEAEAERARRQRKK